MLFDYFTESLIWIVKAMCKLFMGCLSHDMNKNPYWYNVHTKHKSYFKIQDIEVDLKHSFI